MFSVRSVSDGPALINEMAVLAGAMANLQYIYKR